MINVDLLRHVYAPSSRVGGTCFHVLICQKSANYFGFFEIIWLHAYLLESVVVGWRDDSNSNNNNNNNNNNNKRSCASAPSASETDSSGNADSDADDLTRQGRVYRCPHCPQATRSARCHLRHLVADHGGSFEIFECAMCEYATRYEYKLPRHEQCHLREMTQTDAATTMQCDAGEEMQIDVVNDVYDGDDGATPTGDGARPPAPSVNGDDDKSAADEKIGERNINTCAVWQVQQVRQVQPADAVCGAPGAGRSEDTPAERAAILASRLTLKLSKRELPATTTTTNSESDDLPDAKPGSDYANGERDGGYADAAGEKIGEASSGAFLRENFALKAEPAEVRGRGEIESLLELERSAQRQNAPPAGAGVKRKVYSAVREAVDPAKYVIIHEIDGTKFACSRCGNIYKWRKSLNKHWKEKHDGEAPPPLPPGAAAAAAAVGGRGRGGRKTGGRGGGGAGKVERLVERGSEVKVARLKVEESSVTAWPQMELAATAPPYDGYLPTSPDIQPPTAHSHHYQQRPLAALTPETAAVDLSLQSALHEYDDRYDVDDDDDDDDDENALDLSRAGANAKMAPSAPSPPQDEPLDFSVTKADVGDVFRHRASHCCARCGRTFDSAGDATRHRLQCCHLRAGEQTEPRHACHVCGEAFLWKRALADHFLRAHAPRGPYPAPPPAPPLGCGQCDFVAGCSTQLARHSLKHSLTMRALACRLCPFRAARPLQLSTHYSLLHATQTASSPRATSSPSSQRPAGGRVIDLTADGTVIVIPQAPEDVATAAMTAMTGGTTGGVTTQRDLSSAELLLPYKCSVCEYRARWPSEISQHMKNHSDEKPYHCPRCAYRSKWKWDVVKHLKRCGGGTVDDVIDTSKQRARAAAKCDAAAPPPSSPPPPPPLPPLPAKRQVLSAGPPNVTVSDGADEKTDVTTGELCCAKCAFVAHSVAELHRHVRVHYDEKPFICRTCGYCSKWKCDLKKHLRAYDHTPATPLTYGGHGRRPAKMSPPPLTTQPPPPPAYKCDSCGFATYHQAQLERHMRQLHATRLSCVTCAFQSADVRGYLQHKLTHDAVPAGSDALGAGVAGVAVCAGGSGTAYGCRRCAFTSRSQRVARRHAEWHGRGLPAACLHCDYSRRAQAHVETHMKRVHSAHASDTRAPSHARAGTRYRCSQCTWTTTDRRRMLRHKHPAAHKCTQCTHACPSAALLARHAARAHGSARPRMHACARCPFVGGSAAMTAHRRGHGAGLRYVCEDCDFSVKRVALIFSHRRLHRRPSRCESSPSSSPPAVAHAEPSGSTSSLGLWAESPAHFATNTSRVAQLLCESDFRKRQFAKLRNSPVCENRNATYLLTRELRKFANQSVRWLKRSPVRATSWTSRSVTSESENETVSAAFHTVTDRRPNPIDLCSEVLPDPSALLLQTALICVLKYYPTHQPCCSKLHWFVFWSITRPISPAAPNCTDLCSEVLPDPSALLLQTALICVLKYYPTHQPCCSKLHWFADRVCRSAHGYKLHALHPDDTFNHHHQYDVFQTVIYIHIM